MKLDQDIKIASDRPSQDVKRDKALKEMASDCSAAEISNAKALGRNVARIFIADATEAEKNDENGNFDMMLQRRLLLSFTATVGFEQFCSKEMLGGIALKSFLDTVKRTDAELYKTSSDTGAFSFYYLAYRRGSEVDRRIGQTFAMLCSHDGDPIFQELGEALYCWFSSEIKKQAEELGL